MNVFIHDGTEFDLDIAYRDVTGVEWQWSGERTPEGVPLMWECSHKSESNSTISLPDLYKQHGPLIPIRGGLTSADIKAAIDIDPNYADTEASGYLEPLDAFEARIPKPAPVIAVPQLTAHHLPPSPLQQTGFRRFLSTLKGARNA